MDNNLKNETELFFGKMSFPSTVSLENDHEGNVKISVQSNDGKFLIGTGGEIIAAIDVLLKKVLQKKYPGVPRFFLDINGYRQRKYELLEENAKNFAKQARLYRKTITLYPMPALERRVVHSVLSEYPDIVTESIGAEPERRIVIKPFEQKITENPS